MKKKLRKYILIDIIRQNDSRVSLKSEKDQVEILVDLAWNDPTIKCKNSIHLYFITKETPTFIFIFLFNVIKIYFCANLCGKDNISYIEHLVLTVFHTIY